MRNLGLFVVWVGVTLFVTGLTWQIVSAAEGQVSDGPLTQQLDQSTSTSAGPDGTTPSTGGGVSTTTPSGLSTTSFYSDSSTSTLSGSTTTDGTVTTGNGGTIPTTTVPGTETTTTTPGGSTTTTVPGGGGSTTTTTEPGSTSTTVPPSDEQWALRSIPTIGGTVLIKYRTNQVRLVSATPLPGFRVDVDEPGPPEVRVDLISATVSVEVRAKWGSKGLEVEVREDRD